MKRHVDIITRSDVLAILKVAGRGKTARRNVAAFVVMWRAGLRASETSDLLVRDVDMHKLEIFIRSGKGGKSRTVGMDPQTAAMVELWIRDRNKFSDVTTESPLFCSLRGKKVHRTYWGKRIRHLAKKANIGKRIYPHALRHVFSVELLQEGSNLEDIRLLMGHASTRTLQHYFTMRGLPATLDVVRKRTW